MARLRSRREVVVCCSALAAGLRAALERIEEAPADPAVADAVWQGEGLGVLLWALELVELPPYDRPFEQERLLETAFADGALRPAEEIRRAQDTARLWHWRARTAQLDEGDAELPEPWQSFDQLVAATAMRGHELGLLPRPVRGDFPAFGADFRRLDEEQHAEAHLIAWERHRALNWLCGLGKRWDDVPTDT